MAHKRNSESTASKHTRIACNRPTERRLCRGISTKSKPPIVQKHDMPCLKQVELPPWLAQSLSQAPAMGTSGQDASEKATGLFHGHVNQIFIFESKLLGCVVRRNALTIHHETHLRSLQTETAAIRIHQLSQWCGL